MVRLFVSPNSTVIPRIEVKDDSSLYSKSSFTLLLGFTDIEINIAFAFIGSRSKPSPWDFYDSLIADIRPVASN